MPNVESDGTLTSDGTEQDLFTSTNDRVFQILINMDNSTSTETVVIKEKVKVLSGDTVALVKSTTLVGTDGGLPGGAVIFQTDPLASKYGVTVTFQKTAGTNRTYKWTALNL